MSNEVRPYPGFSAMLEEFQELFADWAVGGYTEHGYYLSSGAFYGDEPGAYISPSPYLRTVSDSIAIRADYARKQKLFTSSTTIDIPAIDTFCQRNGLHYRAVHHRQDDTESLIIEGTPQCFLNSELNGKLVRSRQRAQSLVPLAQKFYEWEGMKRIRFTINDENNRSRIRNSDRHPLVVYASGAHYAGYEDNEHYTYPGVSLIHFNSDGGYRNLQSEDEIIAFTIAIKACEWHTEPKLIDWSQILWNIRFDNYPNGESRLTNMPTYRAKCRFTDPAPTPRTYNDFF